MKRLGYQLRLSALSGVETALTILFVGIAMIPVTAGIKWLFKSTRIDWRASLVVAASLAAIWYVAICVSAFVDLRRDDARRVTKRKVFPATTFIAGVYGAVVLMSSAIAIGMYREGDPTRLQFINLGFFALAFYGWPRAIHCDENAVWQRSLFGFKKSIPYEEIISVAQGEKSVIVTGDHETIEHSQYHSDPDEFFSVISGKSRIRPR